MTNILLWSKWLGLIGAGIVILYLFHRLLLRMEEKGWIYYKNKKASPGTRASAALELQRILEPSKKHVLEVQQEVHYEDDEKGED